MLKKFQTLGNDDIYDDEEEEEEDHGDDVINGITNNRKKGKRGRRNQWPKSWADDLVDIILENEKFKEKLLLTNVKNVKNSQYYAQVIVELKERCSSREEEYTFDINKTRQKFKRCVTICRNASMKIKTASGIKRFQESKDFGSWFNKLLPVISSMDNCQPDQAVEPGSYSTPPPSNQDQYENDDSATPDDDDRDTPESGRKSTRMPRESDRNDPETRKRKSYVPTPSTKKKSLKTETILGEIKETMSSLKTLASDTSSKDIFDFQGVCQNHNMVFPDISLTFP